MSAVCCPISISLKTALLFHVTQNSIFRQNAQYSFRTSNMAAAKKASAVILQSKLPQNRTCPVITLKHCHNNCIMIIVQAASLKPLGKERRIILFPANLSQSNMTAHYTNICQQPPRAITNTINSTSTHAHGHLSAAFP